MTAAWKRGPAILWIAAVATAVLWWTAFTQPPSAELEAQKTSYIYDFVHFYRPNAEYMAARWREGDLPLWNPHQALGAPFLATAQPGALYPPNALHLFCSPHVAFAVLAALHIALSVLFAGALASALGASPVGAATAGLLYAISIQVLGNVWIPPVLHASAWIPAILLCVDRVIATTRVGWAALLSVSLAMQLLTGWPYVVAITAVGAFVYASVLLAGRGIAGRSVPWQPVVLGTGGVIVGLCLAAPQLLPTMELLAESCRAAGSMVRAQATFVYSSHDPALFFAQLWSLGGNDSIPSPTAAALALAAIWPASWGWRRAGRSAALPRRTLALWALIAVGALGLAASFPFHLPVYDGLTAIPLLGDFRFPFRYRVLALLAVAVLAALGVTRVEAWTAARGRESMAVGSILLVLAVAPAVWICWKGVPRFPRDAAKPVAQLRDLTALGQLPATDFRRIYWTKHSSKIGAAGDLHVVHDLEPFYLRRTAELLTYFGVGEPLRVGVVHRKSQTGQPRRRRARAGQRDARTGFEEVAAPFAGNLPMDRSGERAAVLDVISADVVAVQRKAAWFPRRLSALEGAADGWSAYANPGALPHAYRVEAAEQEPSRLQAALDRLVSRDFDRRRVVLLDEPPGFATQAALRGQGLPEATALRARQTSPERVVVSTRGDAPGIVVLTDAYFPGWEAKVDGDAVPILRANTAVRAVAVPPGEHTIEFEYRPVRLSAGFVLAAFGAVVCGLALWRDRRRPG